MKLRRKLIKENYKEVFVTNDDDSIKDAKQELKKENWQKLEDTLNSYVRFTGAR